MRTTLVPGLVIAGFVLPAASSRAADDKALTPTDVIKLGKALAGLVRVQFKVAAVSVVRADRGRRVIVDLAPEGLKEDGDSFTVHLPPNIVRQLQELGIENPAVHFDGKEVRVRGRVEARPGVRITSYWLAIDSINQIEAKTITDKRPEALDKGGGLCFVAALKSACSLAGLLP